MTHDPLCPFRAFIPAKIKGKTVDYQNWDSEFMDPPKPTQYYVPCQCDLITKVRADERNGCIKELENYYFPDEDTDYWTGFEDGIRKSIDLLDMGRTYD